MSIIQRWQLSVKLMRELVELLISRRRVFVTYVSVEMKIVYCKHAETPGSGRAESQFVRHVVIPTSGHGNPHLLERLSFCALIVEESK